MPQWRPSVPEKLSWFPPSHETLEGVVGGGLGVVWGWFGGGLGVVETILDYPTMSYNGVWKDGRQILAVPPKRHHFLSGDVVGSRCAWPWGF